MKKQKRALAIHDISCVGKCSLTVALPILSAAGIETSVLPTSILSTHTGGFSGYTFLDLTQEIMPIADHWRSLDLAFDAIYTGYLGSASQLELVKKLFARFGKDALILVDPVMADNGRLYDGFDADFPAGMAKLCKIADVIVPNLTEATLMLNEPYVKGPYTEEYIEGLLRRLGEAFGGKIVLTGVYFDESHLGMAYLDTASEEIGFYIDKLIGGYYHGTGDVFASALLAGLLCDLPLKDAGKSAVKFTIDAIEATDPEREPRYGVRFEAALPGLMKRVGLLLCDKD